MSFPARVTGLASALILTVGIGVVGLLAGSRSYPQAFRTDEEISLAHGGRRRSYLLHVPARGSERDRPLVLAFHGGGGNASGFRGYAGLDALADREGLIVAYPNGTGPIRSLLLTFNAGNNCCGSALRQRVDDVGFAIAVIEDVAKRARIDRRRVYATGHSNGAIMAYRLAAERAEVVAAIAPVAGAMSLDRFAPARPVPVMHIHSVDDPRALFAGGVGPPFPGTDNRVTHAAVETAVGQWVGHNGCRAAAVTAETRRGKPGAPDASHTATRLNFAPCSSGADVVLWKLTGAGHGWPGGPSPVPERLSGPRTTIVNAAEEIWAFVSKHSR
jgi:polyhydroxybutyrate depolymerase